jgi:hypothetical protein
MLLGASAGWGLPGRYPPSSGQALHSKSSLVVPLSCGLSVPILNAGLGSIKKLTLRNLYSNGKQKEDKRLGVMSKRETSVVINSVPYEVISYLSVYGKLK